MLKRFLVFGCLASVLAVQPAYASCQSKAASAAAQRGGTVLSVKSSGNNCVIRILVSSNGSAPKRITVTLPK